MAGSQTNNKFCIDFFFISYDCYQNSNRRDKSSVTGWLPTLNFQYLAIYTNENLPNGIKNCSSRFKILPNTWQTLTNCQRSHFLPDLVTLYTSNLAPATWTEALLKSTNKRQNLFEKNNFFNFLSPLWLRIKGLEDKNLVNWFMQKKTLPILIMLLSRTQSQKVSLCISKLIHTSCIWRCGMQETVVLTQIERKIPIYVLTQSTVESADCCSKCECALTGQLEPNQFEKEVTRRRSY